jgi:hypothetical protein
MADDRGPKAIHLIMTMLIIFLLVHLSNIDAAFLLNKFLLSSTDFKAARVLTLCHMVACVLMNAGVAV